MKSAQNCLIWRENWSEKYFENSPPQIFFLKKKNAYNCLIWQENWSEKYFENFSPTPPPPPISF